ncbi:MAG TPA: DnaJ domain-containing protein [Acidimicrobiia bacterium]|nr:DnaJ domain-containing protein [Acidimicrobiia bacterium]
MSDDLTHYELLEVDPDAAKDDIRTAYQATLANVRAARDKEEDTKKPSETVIRAAREEEARLRAAWQVLSDPVQRQRYDEKYYGPAEDGDGTEADTDLEADADAEDADAALVPV